MKVFNNVRYYIFAVAFQISNKYFCSLPYQCFSINDSQKHSIMFSENVTRTVKNWRDIIPFIPLSIYTRHNKAYKRTFDVKWTKTTVSSWKLHYRWGKAEIMNLWFQESSFAIDPFFVTVFHFSFFKTSFSTFLNSSLFTNYYLPQILITFSYNSTIFRLHESNTHF